MSTSNTPRATVDSLVKLIASSTQDAVSWYEQNGHDVPSLNASHPLDYSQNTLALKKAIRILEGACEQLCSTLALPCHTISNRICAQFEPSCLRVAVEVHIPDLLLDRPNGVHVNELSEKTGIESGKLGRILRLLAIRHCFCEVSPNVFANTRLSLPLLQSNPTSDLVGFGTDEPHKGTAFLCETLTDPQYASSYEITKSPFIYAQKTTGNEKITGGVFDYYRENPYKNARFGRAMTAWALTIGTDNVIDNFPWKDLPAGTTICDVGGGIGSLSIQLARIHPNLTITLQDLPDTIELAKTHWDKEYPAAKAENRVAFVPMDFLKQAPVTGQDIYYLRHIIHDWPDQEALAIFKNIQKAMKLGSRLLIHDFVLQYTDDTTNKPLRDAAPKPLLSNFGSGSRRQYNQDLNMLTLFNSKERLLEDVTTLGKQAGLKLVKLWDLGEASLLEFSLS